MNQQSTLQVDTIVFNCMDGLFGSVLPFVTRVLSMHFEVVFVPLHDRWPPYEVRATPMVVFQSNQVKSFRFHPQSVLNLHTKSLKIAWAGRTFWSWPLLRPVRFLSGFERRGFDGKKPKRWVPPVTAEGQMGRRGRSTGPRNPSKFFWKIMETMEAHGGEHGSTC